MVLAFDQSTKKTAYAVFENDFLKAYDLIDLSKNKDINERSRMMGIELSKIIDKVSPTEIYIEGVQDQNNINTVIHLARIQGMILGYCAARDIPVFIVAPVQWRKVLGFAQGRNVKREQLKQASIDYVRDNFGLDIKSDDICDAICLGVAAQKMYLEDL